MSTVEDNTASEQIHNNANISSDVVKQLKESLKKTDSLKGLIRGFRNDLISIERILNESTVQHFKQKIKEICDNLNTLEHPLLVHSTEDLREYFQQTYDSLNVELNDSKFNEVFNDILQDITEEWVKLSESNYDEQFSLDNENDLENIILNLSEITTKLKNEIRYEETKISRQNILNNLFDPDFAKFSEHLVNTNLISSENAENSIQSPEIQQILTTLQNTLITLRNKFINGDDNHTFIKLCTKALNDAENKLINISTIDNSLNCESAKVSLSKAEDCIKNFSSNISIPEVSHDGFFAQKSPTGTHAINESTNIQDDYNDDDSKLPGIR